MIDIQTAFNNGLHFFSQLYTTNKDVKITNILLEEVYKEKYKEIDDCWFLTYGFNEEKNTGEIDIEPSPISGILGIKNNKSNRKYKIIVLSPEGEFLAMKIRELEYA